MADGLKKGVIAQGLVTEMLFPDKGLVRVETEAGVQTVVVRGALPEEEVLFRVSKKRRSKTEGTLLEVLRRSPKEVRSDCPHFPACGGCLMRTLPYEEQLRLKEKQVPGVLKDVCPDLPFEGVIPSPVVTGYRNKMEFSFGDSEKNGPLQLGLHKKGSFYDILTTDRCQIVDADFRMILERTLALARAYGLPYYHRVRHTGYLRHLLIRKGHGTGEILIGLVTAAEEALSDRELSTTGDLADRSPFADTSAVGASVRESSTTETTVAGTSAGETTGPGFPEALADGLEKLPLDGKIVGILHITNTGISDTIRADRIRILRGRDHFYEKLGTLTFRISPFSFFQTNSAGAKVLYDKVREYACVRPGMHIYDLYSGTGTIAQMLAQTAEQVTGVEIVEEAVEAAALNAAANGLSNCSFIAGDVLKVLDELTQKPDLIILDPPRDGIHPKALSKILAYGVEEVVYISCKVTSLARDLPAFLEVGYRVARCCCVDMFPATANIETVVLLRR